MLPSAKAEEMVVLAIDDDADVICLLKEKLGDVGYRVMGALSAAEGLEKVKTLTHDKAAHLQDSVAQVMQKQGLEEDTLMQQVRRALEQLSVDD
jgi:CheY-like chemotaxis protein